MHKISTSIPVAVSLLVVTAVVSLAGCASTSPFPQLPLTRTSFRPAQTQVPPPVRFPQTAVPPVQLPGLAGPMLVSRDPGGSTAVPDLPITPVVQRTVVDPSASETTRTVLSVSSAMFDEHVLQSDVPVLVDFYADWCGPCKILSPTLDEVAAENPNARVVKVNIDHSPDIAARYGVKSVPRLVVIKGGQIAAQHTGVVSKSRLNAMLAL